MEPPSTVSVSIRNESGVPAPTARIRSTLKAALAYHGVRRGQLSVLLAGDESIRELNRQYRGIDESTDVLTFPAGDWPGRSRPLGDIAISVPYAHRQSSLRRITPADEICLLAMHGALHLVGFDDESDDDRSAMQREMARVAEILGLPVDPAWTSLAHEAAR